MAFLRLDADGVRRRPKVDVCYLCGEKLAKPRSHDHVPPKDFFPKAILEETKLNLWTLPTHTLCNNAYKDDEEYFIATLRYHVGGTRAGSALTLDFLASVTRHEGTRRLFGRAFREMEFRHFATASSRGAVVVAMNHDDGRIRRVCWKIVRGLYFLERGAVLAESSAVTFEGLSHTSQIDDAFLGWWQGASGGYPYRHVFDYRFKAPEQSGTGEEQWALLLWEGLFWKTGFPPPRSD